MDETPGIGGTVVQPMPSICNYPHKQHPTAEPLLRSEKHKLLKDCLRHRIFTHVYRHWHDWAAGKGESHGEEVSIDAFAQDIKKSELAYLSRWKTSTVENYGNLDCYTEEEDQEIQAILDESRPSEFQKQKWTLRRNPKKPTIKDLSDAERETPIHPKKTMIHVTSSSTAATATKRKRGLSLGSQTANKRPSTRLSHQHRASTSDTGHLAQPNQLEANGKPPCQTALPESSSPSPERLEPVLAHRSKVAAKTTMSIVDESSEDEQNLVSSSRLSRYRRGAVSSSESGSSPRPINNARQSNRRANGGFTPINRVPSFSPAEPSHMPNISLQRNPHSEALQPTITWTAVQALVDAIITMASEKGAEQAHSYLENMVGFFEGAKHQEYIEEVTCAIKHTMAAGRSGSNRLDESPARRPEPDHAGSSAMVNSKSVVTFIEALFDLARGSAGLGRAKGQLHVAGFWTLVKDDAYVEDLTKILRDVANLHREAQ